VNEQSSGIGIPKLGSGAPTIQLGQQIQHRRVVPPHLSLHRDKLFDKRNIACLPELLRDRHTFRIPAQKMKVLGVQHVHPIVKANQELSAATKSCGLVFPPIGPDLRLTMVVKGPKRATNHQQKLAP
jgi:hypothetical protein